MKTIYWLAGILMLTWGVGGFVDPMGWAGLTPSDNVIISRFEHMGTVFVLDKETIENDRQIKQWVARAHQILQASPVSASQEQEAMALLQAAWITWQGLALDNQADERQQRVNAVFLEIQQTQETLLALNDYAQADPLGRDGRLWDRQNERLRNQVSTLKTLFSE